MAKSIRSPLGRSRFYWTLDRDRIDQIVNDYPKKAKNLAKVDRNLDFFKQISRDNRTFNDLAVIHGLNQSTVRDIVYELYIKSSNSIERDIVYYKRNRHSWLTKRMCSADKVKI